MEGSKFSIVVAADNNRGIGIDGKLPWRLSQDMKFFRTLTTGDPPDVNAVIMGRKTWESIPSKFRPLPGRTNVVVTRNKTYEVPDGVIVAGGLAEALTVNANKIFVIGGSEIYSEAINHPDCIALYLTHVHGEYECDTHFPSYDSFRKDWVFETLNEGGVIYSIERWLRD